MFCFSTFFGASMRHHETVFLLLYFDQLDRSTYIDLVSMLRLAPPTGFGQENLWTSGILPSQYVA